ncbi:MAG: site-2 protease family protein [Candidatus Promineifilaceae bacterium]|nr:site-2 protease family protein [Candidatus Promineifilaceae bacterium]
MLYFLNDFDIVQIVAFLVVAVVAFAYHEFAHAIVADYLGDNTPRSYGRITPNPFVHLDAFGMIMLVLAGFGWATTPVNPNNLRGNPRTAYAVVAAAGPAANMLMAILFAIPLRFFWFQLTVSEEPLLRFLLELCWMGVNLNLLLFIFNLLPIPPLDGFTILIGVLPSDLAYQLLPVRQYGMYILLLVIFILPMVGFLNVFNYIWGFINAVRPLLTGL